MEQEREDDEVFRWRRRRRRWGRSRRREDGWKSGVCCGVCSLHKRVGRRNGRGQLSYSRLVCLSLPHRSLADIHLSARNSFQLGSLGLVLSFSPSSLSLLSSFNNLNYCATTRKANQQNHNFVPSLFLLSWAVALPSRTWPASTHFLLSLLVSFLPPTTSSPSPRPTCMNEKLHPNFTTEREHTYTLTCVLDHLCIVLCCVELGLISDDHHHNRCYHH